LGKKTFEISNIQSIDELNMLSLALNEEEQVSHMKISKDNIVFHCIDIEPLLSIIHHVNKEFIVKEVIDGKKRQYDFVQSEKKHYFMFKNMLVEDDIIVLKKKIETKDCYSDVEYDSQNKILMLVSRQRDVLSYLRKELAKINPSIEIFEHRKPIRSQDVFNQKFIKTYIKIGIFALAFALALVTSKDHSVLTPFFWLIALLILSEHLVLKAWDQIKQKRFLSQDILVLIAFVIGIMIGEYIQTCVASLLYQAISPLLDKVLYSALKRVDEAVEIPEKGIRMVDEKQEEIALRDFEINDLFVVPPKGTVHIPGYVYQGEADLSTYSNTSTYELQHVVKGDLVHSGDINMSHEPLVIQVSETYESSNFMELMNIASVAPSYESKLEKIVKRITKYYTPVMIALGILIGIILPLVNYHDYGMLIHSGAVLLIISGALYSDQSTSLGVLAGFAKAFQNGIIVESSLGLDSINATQIIIYDRFDGVEVTQEELELFKKLAHMGKTLMIFNDGPVALENDQYIIFNDLTLEEKLEKIDSAAGPVAYIGDSFKDIALLQKSYMGISRGGLSDPKVVESSDIVLIDSALDKVYQTFAIARKMRRIAIAHNIFALLMKFVVLCGLIAYNALPLWLVIIVEILTNAIIIYSSTYILE